MKAIAITQARINSTRLPKKVLLKLGDDTILGIHLKRLLKSKTIDQVVVATTFEEESQKIINIAKKYGVVCFQGSVDDVLDRFYQVAKELSPDYIVRVTSDCPLIDSKLIDQIVNEALKGDYDYYSNVLIEDFPDGLDVEVIKFSALEKAWEKAFKKSDREHVTPYIRANSSFYGENEFKSGNFEAPENYNSFRMTVDEMDDYTVLKWLVNNLGDDKDWIDYVHFMDKNRSELLNRSILRNEGYKNSVKKDSYE